MSEQSDVNVRLMFPHDLPQVLHIEGRQPGRRWQQHDFLPVFLSYHTDAWVAEIDGRVIGYIVFRVSPEHQKPATVTLLNLAVAPYWRRRGIASGMVEHLCHKLSEGRIRAVVPEANLPVQLFLRSMGFKAVQVLRGHYGDRDAYVMERRVGAEQPTHPQHSAASA